MTTTETPYRYNGPVATMLRSFDDMRFTDAANQLGPAIKAAGDGIDKFFDKHPSALLATQYGVVAAAAVGICALTTTSGFDHLEDVAAYGINHLMGGNAVPIVHHMIDTGETILRNPASIDRIHNLIDTAITAPATVIGAAAAAMGIAHAALPGFTESLHAEIEKDNARHVKATAMKLA